MYIYIYILYIYVCIFNKIQILTYLKIHVHISPHANEFSYRLMNLYGAPQDETSRFGRRMTVRKKFFP